MEIATEDRMIFSLVMEGTMIRKKSILVNEKFLCYYGKTMDVTLLSEGSLKIKSKKASLVVDPKEKTPKTAAEGVLLLEKEAALNRVEGARLVVNDDGEYEIGGLKITGNSSLNSGIFYLLNVDGTQALLAKTSTLEKLSDTANEAEVAILNVDSLLNESIIASLEAKSIILYGQKASEGLKALGKQDLTPTKKITVGKEKLPEESETQIVWLA